MQVIINFPPYSPVLETPLYDNAIVIRGKKHGNEILVILDRSICDFVSTSFQRKLRWIVRGLEENIELEIIYGESYVVDKSDTLSQGALDPRHFKCGPWTNIT